MIPLAVLKTFTIFFPSTLFLLINLAIDNNVGIHNYAPDKTQSIQTLLVILNSVPNISWLF